MNGFFVVTAVIDASMNFIDVVSLFYNYYRTPLKNWLDHNHKNASALLFSQEFSDTVEKPFYIVMCLFICSKRWSGPAKGSFAQPVLEWTFASCFRVYRVNSSD